MKITIDKSFIGYLIIAALFFAEPLSSVWYSVTGIDELITLFGWIILLIAIIRNRGLLVQEKWKLVVLSFVLGILSIGLLGNLCSGVSRTIWNIFLDAYNYIRIWGSFLLFDFAFPQSTKIAIKKRLLTFSKYFTILCMAFYPISQLSGIMTGDTRFGIKSYSFIYNNPGSFSNYCVVLLAISLFEGKISAFTIMNCFLLISTLRFKSFGVAVFFLVFSIGNKTDKNFTLLKWGTSLVGAFFVGVDQLESYFGSVNTPRKLFLETSIRIANDYFPLGSGFGTFGTSVAANNYSPLYSKYGMSQYWFFHKTDEYNYLNDNFWPAILGELGWIGIGIYITLLLYLYCNMAKACGGRFYDALSLKVIFAAIVIASLGGPILFGQYGTLFFAIIPIILVNDSTQKQKT